MEENQEIESVQRAGIQVEILKKPSEQLTTQTHKKEEAPAEIQVQKKNMTEQEIK